MNKDEILAKSRAELKNQDIYEQEVLKEAEKNAVLVQMVLAAVFFVAQIVTGGGLNWGLWALVYSSGMTISWVKYRKLRRRHDLTMAMLYTLFVCIMGGYHIYSLAVSSTIL